MAEELVDIQAVAWADTRVVARADTRVVARVDTRVVVPVDIQVVLEDTPEVDQVDFQVAREDTPVVDTLVVPALEVKEDIQEVLASEVVTVDILAEVVTLVEVDTLVEDTLEMDTPVEAVTPAVEDLADLEVLDQPHRLSMEPPLVNLVVLAVLEAHRRSMVLRAVSLEVATEVSVVPAVLERHPVNMVHHLVVLEVVVVLVALVHHPNMELHLPTHSDLVIQIDTQAPETPTVATEDKKKIFRECFFQPFLVVLIFFVPLH